MGARIGGARIGKELARSRAADGRRELALDLTPSEVVLHEGNARQGWRRFAGVALGDPEFREVIGLLRAEAEGELGAGAPVRLWLPGEQVLRLSVRIDGRDPRARLRAAFRRASEATGNAPEDLAVALGPEGADGEATLLVTYAATWREARDYAARWGFVPGPVSTRHHAEAFGPAGPEFRPEDDLREEEEGAGPRRLAWLAMAIAAAVFWAAPAPASQAPAAAPVPAARVLAPAQEAEATPAAPDEPATAGEPDLQMDAQLDAQVDPQATATPGGLAAPLPAWRPERGMPAPAPAAPPASAPTSPPAVASAGAVFLPPVRPPGLAARAMRRLERVTLLGILNLDTGREALVRLADGDFVTLAAGEAVYGWEVSSIGTDAMEVRRGSESRTLELVSR